MEARRESQSGRRRLEVVPSSKRGRKRRTAVEAQADIVCLYGVVIVQRVCIAGLELIEFEFFPDAA